MVSNQCALFFLNLNNDFNCSGGLTWPWLCQCEARSALCMIDVWHTVKFKEVSESFFFMIHLVIYLLTRLVHCNAPPHHHTPTPKKTHIWWKDQLRHTFNLWNAALNSPPTDFYKYYARPKVTFVTDLAFLLNFGILPLLSSSCTKQNSLHHHHHHRLQINGQNVVFACCGIEVNDYLPGHCVDASYSTESTEGPFFLVFFLPFAF